MASVSLSSPRRRLDVGPRGCPPLFVKAWIGTFLIAAFVGFLGLQPARGNPFQQEDREPTPANKIDELIFARLKSLGIRPARPCSDAVFIRRVYLDLIGTLPTEAEVRRFLSDTAENKREKLIDALFDRPEFADYWALKWGDVLRIKSEFPINLWPNAVQAYARWVRAAIAQNMPYDQFARELLTSSGSNFRVPPVNFYRAVADRSPSGLAAAAALTFMGVRVGSWPPESVDQLAVFFSQVSYKSTGEWKEEIVVWDPLHAAVEKGIALPERVKLPDGTEVHLSADRDPREVFADWLIRPENPWFCRAVVNRIWAWLFGRGIVHEPDDFRPDNPPVHPDVLDYLAQELVAAKYDLRHIYRLIVTSQTYQLSPIPRSSPEQSAKYFAHYAVRRLEAEVLIDAINQITGTGEDYWSMVPEPYTIVPEWQRSIALADASITSTFLELFGRPPRDTGYFSERINRMTAGQRLHLLNSSHILRKIQQGPGLAFARSTTTPRETIERLYLTILSRYPTPEEMDQARSLAPAGSRRTVDLTDLAWALINSSEFLYRH
ncbi:MAG: DUF1549 and DUF1553 domain-containing protein [Thermoguttaceae bacterium]|nr:DUF1549 and DUF1553 domain-containing protein [Thermoguttaceae bacterium]MDW8078382.1 DUF1553 domain-containing protein [Thermoguttaceae bacterium]